MVLDAGSEQAMVFPPVGGIVPDSVAVGLTERVTPEAGPRHSAGNAA